MLDKKFPDWFINALWKEEDKEKARNSTLNLDDIVYFQCPEGHITKCKLSSKIHIKTMTLKNRLCPICGRKEKAESYKKTKAKKRMFPQWFIDELVNEEDKEKAKNNTLQGEDLVTLRCSKGHVYSKKVCFRIKQNGDPNTGCLQCVYEDNIIRNQPRYIYPQWFINELVDSHDIELAKSGKLPVINKVKIKCPDCGNEYTRYVRLEINVKTGERIRVCPKCMLKTKNYNHKKHELDYPQWFIDQIVDPRVKQEAIDKTLTAKREVEFKCPNGHLFKRIVANYITITTMQQRTECPECKRINKNLKLASNRNYPDWLINEIVKEEDREKARLGTLKSTDTIEFFCKRCNKSYLCMVGARYRARDGFSKQACPNCASLRSSEKMNQTISKKRIYPQWFIDELVNEKDKEKAKLGTLRSSLCAKFKCEYGHIYTQRISNHIHMHIQKPKAGCPICSSNRSKTEIEIEKYIQFLGLNTEHKKWTLNRDPFRYLEVDIYIPEKKIGIEYNGCFWHKTLPNDNYNKDKFFHQNKYLTCQKLGIRLISIFEPDWTYRKEKIKQYLKDLLLPMEHRIYARNCELKEIDYKIANSMYDQYHLLGTTTIQSVSYGLFYNDELLSCMSFQKGRYTENNKPAWTLTRFVTRSGYSIVGGASKLLKRFEKEYTPDILLSYSDNDYFSGGLYSNLGFRNDGCTKSPRYFWWLEDKELKREQCQLKKLSEKYPELYTESLNQEMNKEDYIMLNLGASKVYRAGHIRWIKEYNI